MSTCPDCGTRIDGESDLDFKDLGGVKGLLRLEGGGSKRFYVTVCAECGVIVGTGVAGAAV